VRHYVATVPLPLSGSSSSRLLHSFCHLRLGISHQPAVLEVCLLDILTYSLHHMATQQAVSAPWRSLLQRSLTQNSNLPYAKYMQLATARQDGRPSVRTVVFRCDSLIPWQMLHISPCSCLADSTSSVVPHPCM
jgi:hypothetical protein